jgi:hypothetical protein
MLRPQDDTLYKTIKGVLYFLQQTPKHAFGQQLVYQIVKIVVASHMALQGSTDSGLVTWSRAGLPIVTFYSCSSASFNFTGRV